MTLRLATLPTLAAACAILVAPAAPAQDDAPSAPGVLQHASMAIADARTGRAHVSTSVVPQGGMGAKLAPAMPHGSGVFTWRLDDASDEADTRAWRAAGQASHRQDAEAKDIDVVFDQGGAAYLDHARRKVVRVAPRAADQAVMLTENIVIPEVLDERPLVDAFAGADLALEGTATFDGELCDVLVITMPKSEDPKVKQKYLSQKWMIARSDGFPRRIERLGDMSMFGTILYATDIADVSLAPELGDDALTLSIPEGYASGRTTNPTPTAAQPLGTQSAEQREVQPPAGQPPAEHPAAPAFTLTDVNGMTYDNTTQQGRVTVLYYWGTWCVPCRTYSPLTSALAETFAGQPVDVLGLAIRERDAQAPGQMMREKGYRHTLVLGAEDTVRPFNIRIYPTIVVVGPDLTIRAVGLPRRDVAPEDAMAKIEQAVRDALPLGG